MLSNAFTSPFAAAHLLMSALLGYWVYLDADARGSDAALLWSLGCVVVQPLVLGYLLYRSEIGGRPDLVGRTERAVGTFVVAHLTAVLLRSLAVWSNVSWLPAYPYLGIDFYLLFLALGGVPGYWLVWRGGWGRLRREFGWVHPEETTNG